MTAPARWTGGPGLSEAGVTDRDIGADGADDFDVGDLDALPERSRVGEALFGLNRDARAKGGRMSGAVRRAERLARG